MIVKALIINGPNLNMLSVREPGIYRSFTLEEIIEKIRSYPYDCPVEIDHFQSNHEGAIVEKIHDARLNYDFIVINAGALTHYSIAIRDALLSAGVPFAEAHLTNIFSREEFRHKSVTADLAFCFVAGAGAISYIAAVIAGIDMLAGADKNEAKIKSE